MKILKNLRTSVEIHLIIAITYLAKHIMRKLTSNQIVEEIVILAAEYRNHPEREEQILEKVTKLVENKGDEHGRESRTSL